MDRYDVIKMINKICAIRSDVELIGKDIKYSEDVRDLGTFDIHDTTSSNGISYKIKEMMGYLSEISRFKVSLVSDAELDKGPLITYTLNNFKSENHFTPALYFPIGLTECPAGESGHVGIDTIILKTEGRCILRIYEHVIPSAYLGTSELIMKYTAQRPHIFGIMDSFVSCDVCEIFKTIGGFI